LKLLADQLSIAGASHDHSENDQEAELSVPAPASSTTQRPESPRTGVTGWVIVALLVIGAILRIWQYAANTSLWLDEIALTKGILQLDLPSLLTSPLPYDQVAPKGFLLLQKLAVMALGPTEYALRLVPFACSLIALWLFARVAARLLEGIGPVVAVALFATGTSFILLSAIAKQYAVDVCVAVSLLYLSHELMSSDPNTSRMIGAGLAGTLLVWLSQPAVLVITALGSVLVGTAILSARATVRLRRLVFVVACWAISAALVTLAGFASMSTQTREYMYRYWAEGFPPTPPTAALRSFWPWEQVMGLFGQASAGVAYPFPALYVGAMVIGFAALWRRQRETAALVVAPLVITLGAAVARQYPFSNRLILFLFPSFILSIAAATEEARSLVALISRVLAALLVVSVVAPAMYPVVMAPPTYRFEDVKPLLQHLEARRQPGDKMYVYYGAAPAMSFYAARYGMERKEYSVGGCHPGDGPSFLRELDTFRGERRVWIVLVHPSGGELPYILAYLDAIGARKDALVVESRYVGRRLPPARLYLYDLSRPDASNTTANSFAFTGPLPAGSRFSCDGGPTAMVSSDFVQ